MILITLQQIKDASPCHTGWAAILAAHGGDSAMYDKPFPLADALLSNGLDDTLWALRCLPGHSPLWRKFAVWSARQVQHLLTDSRSMSALDVAWAHSNGDATAQELRAAWDAAWDAARAAAGAAARAAAGEAARAAARAAAWDAAGAAAWDAARAAAREAAWEAARAAQATKLRQILEAGCWVE